MSAAVASEPPAIPNATGPDPAVMEAIERGNAVVFLDLALGDGAGAPFLGRIKLELFVQDVSFDGPYASTSKWTESIISLSHFIHRRSAPRLVKTFGR